MARTKSPALEALGMGAVRTGGTLRINGQCMTARGIALADGVAGVVPSRGAILWRPARPWLSQAAKGPAPPVHGGQVLLRPQETAAALKLVRMM